MRFRLTINQQRFALTINYRLVDNHFFDVFHGRQIVHGIEQCGFYDGTQATGTGPAVDGLVGDRVAVVGAGMIGMTTALLASRLPLERLQVVEIDRDVIAPHAKQGAALLFASSLALLANAFPGKEERAKALAAYGATIGASFAVGPLLGGPHRTVGQGSCVAQSVTKFGSDHRSGIEVWQVDSCDRVE